MAVSGKTKATWKSELGKASSGMDSRRWHHRSRSVAELGDCRMMLNIHLTLQSSDESGETVDLGKGQQRFMWRSWPGGRFLLCSLVVIYLKFIAACIYKYIKSYINFLLYINIYIYTHTASILH